jgi:gamma-glutamylputrescine oxidase
MTPRFDAASQSNPYYLATSSQAGDYPRLSDSVRCNVCIIGGGYTRLSAALHGAQLGCDVVVLESATFGAGASGRNGGQLGSGQRRDVLELERMFGHEAARNLWRIGEDAKGLVLQLIERYGIECDLRRGILYPDHKPAYANESRLLVETMQTRFGYSNMSYLNPPEMQEMLHVENYHGGILDHDGWHLHPLKYLHGLLGMASNEGARLFEDSRALSWGRADDGIRITTAKGEVHCQKLLVACNGYLDGFPVPEFSNRVMPVNNFIAATRPLTDDEIASSIPSRHAVADSRFVINYMRIDAQNRLLFGGGETYSYRFPADVATFVRRPLSQVFPQFNDVNIDHAWGGTLAISRNRMPVFAQLEPHLIGVGGFSGHGISIGTLAGKLAIQQFVNGSDADFEAMRKCASEAFPGGRHLAPALLVLGMLAARFRDRFL